VKRAERAVRSAERRLEAETRIARRTTLELDSKKEIVAESASRLDDLSRRADAQARLRRLAEEQRAKLRRLAAATRKAAFDVGDGLKTLAGEIDALRRDEEDKAADLESARVTLREARRVASLTRNELNRAKETKRAADERLNAETGECFSLTAAVSAARRDLSRFKHDAEALVKNRDAIGVAVLERDDELAALYAKSKRRRRCSRLASSSFRNAQRRSARWNSSSRRRRESATSQRARRRSCPALHEQVTALRAALAKEKRETERLGAEAEDPSNANRRRDLAGDAPDRDVLRSKLQRLEKQELEHNALLRKKDAALEELAKTSDAARALASAGRAETLELARAVVDAQGRLRSKRRETEALAAELAMYRAAARGFENTLASVRDALARAERNVAAGAPPDEDAAREWSRVTRWTSAVAAKKNAASRSRDADGSDGDDDFDDRKESQSAFGGKENANAGSRPNAYVPRTPIPRVFPSRTV
jgi:chromosome segregation ATPase